MTRPVNDHAAGYERERVNPKEEIAMSDDLGSRPASPSVPTEGHDAASPTGWHRFRCEEDERFGWVDWPSGCEDVRDLIVWNPCDGYHIWSRYWGDVPPGTHYARLLAPPILNGDA